MRVRDLVRYSRDLGWTDPGEWPEPVIAPSPTRTPASRPDPAAPHPSRDAAPAADPAVAATLDELARRLAGCSRCRLSAGRRQVVVGEGPTQAPLMFIGEGPGVDEDRTGRPFVGQAGQLLDAMILALGLARQDVYIANVVKCRPPGNRDPEEDEMAACSSFLDRQIELVQPRVLVALGRVAARRLTGSTKPMGALRGRWSSYRGRPLLATFHPAYLLRQPLEKRLAWDDLKQVRARLAG